MEGLLLILQGYTKTTHSFLLVSLLSIPLFAAPPSPPAPPLLGQPATPLFPGDYHPGTKMTVDTSYLTTQVNNIVTQLHSVFDDIGVPGYERESREAEVGCHCALLYSCCICH